MTQKPYPLAALLGGLLAAIGAVLALASIILLLVIGVVGLFVEPTFWSSAGEQSLAHVGRPAVLALLVFVLTVCILSFVIVRRLRRVLRRVASGQPFHQQTPPDLRVIAVLLALLELVWLLGRVLLAMLPEPLHQDFDFTISGWLSVFIVFVLAEVFREGARLRADAELTV